MKNLNLTPGALPPFLRDMLASPPRRGQGLHDWLFRVSRQLHAHRTPDQIVALLLSITEAPRREVEDAVRNSVSCAWNPSTTHIPIRRPRWPSVDPVLRAEVLRCGAGLFGLLEASPLRLEVESPRTEFFITQLFTGDPLLCCGRATNAVQTKPLKVWGSSLSDQQFIVPSPMSNEVGTTKDGRPSTRCLDNTGARRFLVVEFDQGTKDDHATIIMYLKNLAPLVMVVDSGGKSLHAWFACAGRSDEELSWFFRLAVRLGADPATFNRCQLVRMPGGIRDDGARQSVRYFNPANLQP